MIESLTSFAEYRPIDEVLKAFVGIITILGNLKSVRFEKFRFICHKSLSNLILILKGLSNYLNYRESFLFLDYKESTTLSVNYDTDL